ncbi:PAS domain S-box protein [Nocardioides iriomotensis]|uniref:PAS domain S-box protein n=1 Tax=Nocardioides iriomotensis TaxID=715784 RepID=UPI00197D72EE|nr:PAS domain S-box protein [Nocardioides iriomotensis]
MSGLPTVVVVDDAPDVRRLLRTRLRLSGRYEVVGEGADGAAAIALAEEHQPTLVLLDVSMPGVDGLEALPRVLAASPATRVLMFSGFEEQGLAERAAELGAAAFLEKSVSLETLLGRMDELAGHAAVDPEPAAAPAADSAGSDDLAVLDEHRERFREVFEEAAIGMATLTLTGRLIRVNRAFASLLGASETALVGTRYADLAHEAQAFDAALDDIRSTPVEVVHLEHTLARTRTTFVRATLAPVRDSAGRALYLFMQVQDVTAEHLALEGLRRSEERFRLLVEAVEDYAIFMLDPQGHIVSWNSGAQRSKLYTADEIIGQHFSVFYPPEVQAAKHPEHELEIALREGQYEEEGWRIRKDGSRFWANVLITAVFNAAGEHVGFAKVTRDTSERRRLEEDREHAVTALAAANAELESLNRRLQRAADDQAQFVAVTAHELRTPVGLLAGSADLLAAHGDRLTDEERTDVMAAISSGTSRLRRLLADLLTASRLQASRIELARLPVDVRELVEGVAISVRSTYPDTEVVVDDLPAVTVEGDRDRLAQVLENFAGNAVRHGAPPVRIGVTSTDRSALVRVSDAGTGVPEELRDRLFDRFATGRSGGTGLGLYIARQLARAHGGDARYEPPSSDQPGGAFVLEVPRPVPSP